MKGIIPIDVLEKKIRLINNRKIMLDKDVAAVFGVSLDELNEAVTKNKERFPGDFMIKLSAGEFTALKSHLAAGRGAQQKPPRIFSEQGIAMLATVLNSRRAVQVSLEIIRAFAKQQEVIASRKVVKDQEKIRARAQKEIRKIIVNDLDR